MSKGRKLGKSIKEPFFAAGIVLLWFIRIPAGRAIQVRMPPVRLLEGFLSWEDIFLDSCSRWDWNFSEVETGVEPEQRRRIGWLFKLSYCLLGLLIGRGIFKNGTILSGSFYTTQSYFTLFIENLENIHIRTAQKLQKHIQKHIDTYITMNTHKINYEHTKTQKSIMSIHENLKIDHEQHKFRNRPWVCAHTHIYHYFHIE